MPALAVLAEADTVIAFIIWERRQYSCVGVFETFDASHIADKVFAIIALYGSPFFIRKIWYSIYGNHRPFIKTKRGTRLRVERNRITSP